MVEEPDDRDDRDDAAADAAYIYSVGWRVGLRMLLLYIAWRALELLGVFIMIVVLIAATIAVKVHDAPNPVRYEQRQ